MLSVVALWWLVVQAYATTFPATIEVDLIFPRNDTYAPTVLFPIVFAFQNPALAPSLDPGFELELFDISSPNLTAYSPTLDLAKTNFSGSNPMFVYTSITNLKAASYILAWEYSASNCTLNQNISGSVNIGGALRSNRVAFTIQSGVQVPDLTGGTTSCKNITNFAFNLTDTLEVAVPAQYDGRNSCAVVSDSQALVAGNPCAVQVGSGTASSISAALTATACLAVTPVVSCRPTSAALRVRDTALTGYMFVLGGIAAAFAGM